MSSEDPDSIPLFEDAPSGSPPPPPPPPPQVQPHSSPVDLDSEGGLDLSLPVDAAGIPQASPIEAKVRDRIVVLGRRKAGKTIFMSRLYEQLWRSDGDLHMRAVSGTDHLYFLRNIKELQEGRWPAATGGSTYAAIEIEYLRRKHLMVILDYAGEVFQRAFVEGIVDDSSSELLDHVDRAAAVILLVDPSVAMTGELEEFADDDFGMASAIRRIRDWPGGKQVPVALVLTKIDQSKRRLEQVGGLVAFVRKYYGPLLRTIGNVKVFGAAAVRQGEDGLGKAVPEMRKPAVGIVEPLTYCLRRLEIVARESEEHQRQIESARRIESIRQAEAEAQQRSNLMWTVFWIGVPLLLVIVAAITLFIVL
jgi:GTPase SAR1 family protein